MIVLIDNYDSFTYNLYQCIETLGFRCKVIRNDAITVEDIRKMAPDRIVISPGPGAPTSAGISLRVIEELGPRIPLLGVCLGHQSIGQVFGGHVIRAKKPKHGKVSEVFHQGQGLYQGLENPFSAARYHSLVVERESLPAILEVTSETKDKVIMGLRHRKLPIEGVQFHPESIATRSGEKLIANFLKRGVS